MTFFGLPRKSASLGCNIECQQKMEVSHTCYVTRILMIRIIIIIESRELKKKKSDIDCGHLISMNM